MSPPHPPWHATKQIPATKFRVILTIYSLTDFTVLYAGNNVTFLGLTVIRSAIDYLARVCSLNERV